jgi:molybdate-binding protein
MGTCLLLVYEIVKSDLFPDASAGYCQEISRHLDVGLAILAITGLLNLDFMLLRWEQFDLFIARGRCCE